MAEKNDAFLIECKNVFENNVTLELNISSVMKKEKNRITFVMNFSLIITFIIKVIR